ncbi:helix-turn-helix transcriptional regulator [Trichlorobacter lovleyi]|uniref:helix-turn-helix transcriptional regulator n=1 Tax=Trichlorobacter lovleyi TaxID=313985 RepID=UPI0024804753|nr:helix-turn-helix transcriptional regulator [Trichlorobacter lovleyi]
MRALTKKHHTETGLVPIQFWVHPANVKRITHYVESVEPGSGEDGITAEAFFDKHFAGESKGSVALKGYRYREGLTQKQLADLIGVAQHHISEMERGKRPIGKETARKLAEALKTDYRVFL